MSLPYGAEALLGGRINLGNEEFVRFELRGSVRTEEELEELVAGFDRALARLGRGDAGAQAAVDAFRLRVLGSGAAPAAGRAVHGERRAAAVPEVAARAEALCDAAGVPADDTHTRNTAKVAVAAMAPPVEPEGEQVCADCGGRVHKDEAKTSRLFYSACLCKACQRARTAASAAGSAP